MKLIVFLLWLHFAAEVWQTVFVTGPDELKLVKDAYLIALRRSGIRQGI